MRWYRVAKKPRRHNHKSGRGSGGDIGWWALVLGIRGVLRRAQVGTT